VVLQQETTKFNVLLSAIRESMMALRRVLLGEAAMSDALEAMHSALLNGRVPGLWAEVAYPSMRPLASWVADLNARVQFIARWAMLGDMKEYWLPAFFFPQGFLTAVLQRHARKYQVAINDLEFQFSFLTRMGVVSAGTGSADPSVTRGKAASDDGVTVHGLYLESGQWSDDMRGLVDPTPGEVYSALPKVRMLPTLHHKTPPGVYTCPVYKTLARAGTLSTTGISTNYVVAVELPTTMSSEHWIWRGTALVLDVMSED
jgi:dynein heavy chain